MDVNKRLSIVLNHEIKEHRITGNSITVYNEILPKLGTFLISNYLTDGFRADYAGASINIDSLVRLFKEFITVKHDYHLDIIVDGHYEIEVIGTCKNSDEFGCLKFASKSYNTEYEAILHTIEFVLKDLDLL